MSRDEFWKLIDTSRRGVADLDEQVAKLLGLVSSLPPQEILSFEWHFQQCVRDAFREDLWAAADIISGGCSDDSFDYFLGWLIAQGRKYYEAALDNSDQSGRRIQPGEDAECEDLWTIAVQAYEARTGKDDFYAIAPHVPRRLRRVRGIENQIDERFPKLAKKFNG